MNRSSQLLSLSAVLVASQLSALAQQPATTSAPPGMVRAPMAPSAKQQPLSPDAKKAKPSIRQFYVTPFEALNAGYRPCKYCEPMSGWE